MRAEAAFCLPLGRVVLQDHWMEEASREPTVVFQ